MTRAVLPHHLHSAKSLLCAAVMMEMLSSGLCLLYLCRSRGCTGARKSTTNMQQNAKDCWRLTVQIPPPCHPVGQLPAPASTLCPPRHAPSTQEVVDVPLRQHHKSMMRSTLTEATASQPGPMGPSNQDTPSPDSPQVWAGIKVPRTLNAPLRCDEDKFNQKSQRPLPFTAGLG